MDTRIVVRYAIEEKNDLSEIADDLGLTLSSYIRKKTLGKNLHEEYIEFIRKSLNNYTSGQIFTLKELLDHHWSYMSKGEKDQLLKSLLDAIDDDDIDVYKVTGKGKYKFVKTQGAKYISDLFKEYMIELNKWE